MDYLTFPEGYVLYVAVQAILPESALQTMMCIYFNFMVKAIAFFLGVQSRLLCARIYVYKSM